MIALVAFILLIGVYPSVLSEPLQQTVNGMTQLLQSVGGNIGG
jgi:NADH-quinone oxidoreductase subunit M